MERLIDENFTKGMTAKLINFYAPFFSYIESFYLSFSVAIIFKFLKIPCRSSEFFVIFAEKFGNDLKFLNIIA